LDFLGKTAEKISFESISSLTKINGHRSKSQDSVFLTQLHNGSTNSLVSSLESFAESIETNEEAKVSFVDGFRSIELAQKIMVEIEKSSLPPSE